MKSNPKLMKKLKTQDSQDGWSRQTGLDSPARVYKVPTHFLELQPSARKHLDRSATCAVVDGPTRALIPYSILDLPVQSPSGPVRMRKANPMIRVVNWALFASLALSFFRLSALSVAAPKPDLVE